MGEVIGGIGNEERFFRRQRFAHAQQQLGAANAAGKGKVGRPDAQRKRSRALGRSKGWMPRCARSAGSLGE